MSGLRHHSGCNQTINLIPEPSVCARQS